MQEWKHRKELGKQGKFRVGDLVQLSAYGKTRGQNESVHFDGDEMGLIVRVEHRGDKYPILVEWINIPKRKATARFFFRELKRKRT